MSELRGILWTRGQQVLAAFKGALEDDGIAIPRRVLLAPGVVPVWDGEQLTVNLQTLVQGQPGEPGVPAPRPPQLRTLAAQWAVSLVREVPVISENEVPQPEDITRAGLQSIEDCGALFAAAQGLHERYVLTRPGQGFDIIGVTPEGPAGGYAAAKLVIELSVA